MSQREIKFKKPGVATTEMSDPISSTGLLRELRSFC